MERVLLRRLLPVTPFQLLSAPTKGPLVIRTGSTNPTRLVSLHQDAHITLLNAATPDKGLDKGDSDLPRRKHPTKKKAPPVPSIRCGTPLHVLCKLPPLTALQEHKVDAVELALLWEQTTTFYKLETRTTGHGKNRRTYTETVRYDGSNTTVPCKTNLWTHSAATTNEETRPTNACFDIPLGLGPSFTSTATGVHNPGGQQTHTVQMRAILEPVAMTWFQTLLHGHWNYTFLGKLPIPLLPPETVVVDQQPLLMLPSVTKRTALLLASEAAVTTDTKFFYTFSSLLNNASQLWSDVGSFFSAGKEKQGKQGKQAKEDSSSASSCATELYIENDVLAGDSDFYGDIYWDNGAAARHPVSAIDVTIQRTTKYSAPSVTYKEASKTEKVMRARVFSREEELRAAEALSTGQKIVISRAGGGDTTDKVDISSGGQGGQGGQGGEAQRKTTESIDSMEGRNIRFNLRVPPLTPSFETELMHVTYTVHVYLRFDGGTVSNIRPQQLSCPVVVVSPLLEGERAERAEKVVEVAVEEVVVEEAVIEVEEKVERVEKVEKVEQVERERRRERERERQRERETEEGWVNEASVSFQCPGWV